MQLDGAAIKGLQLRKIEVNLDALNRQWMAKRNQFSASLGRENASDAGGVKDFTLGHGFIGNGPERLRLERDVSLGNGFPLGDCLPADIDHFRTTLVVEMGEV